MSIFIKIIWETGCICEKNICFGCDATTATTEKYDGVYSIR